MKGLIKPICIDLETRQLLRICRVRYEAFSDVTPQDLRKMALSREDLSVRAGVIAVTTNIDIGEHVRLRG
jgi:hypothetical protein